MNALTFLVCQFIQVLIQYFAYIFLFWVDGIPVKLFLLLDNVVLVFILIFEYFHCVIFFSLGAEILCIVGGANLHEPVRIVKVELATSLHRVDYLFDCGHQCGILSGELRDLGPCLPGEINERVCIVSLGLGVSFVEGCKSFVGWFLHMVCEVIEFYGSVELLVVGCSFLVSAHVLN